MSEIQVSRVFHETNAMQGSPKTKTKKSAAKNSSSDHSNTNYTNDTSLSHSNDNNERNGGSSYTNAYSSNNFTPSLQNSFDEASTIKRSASPYGTQRRSELNTPALGIATNGGSFISAESKQPLSTTALFITPHYDQPSRSTSFSSISSSSNAASGRMLKRLDLRPAANGGRNGHSAPPGGTTNTATDSKMKKKDGPIAPNGDLGQRKNGSEGTVSNINPSAARNVVNDNVEDMMNSTNPKDVEYTSPTLTTSAKTPMDKRRGSSSASDHTSKNPSFSQGIEGNNGKPVKSELPSREDSGKREIEGHSQASSVTPMNAILSIHNQAGIVPDLSELKENLLFAKSRSATPNLLKLDAQSQIAFPTTPVLTSTPNLPTPLEMTNSLSRGNTMVQTKVAASRSISVAEQPSSGAEQKHHRRMKRVRKSLMTSAERRRHYEKKERKRKKRERRGELGAQQGQQEAPAGGNVVAVNNVSDRSTPSAPVAAPAETNFPKAEKARKGAKLSRCQTEDVLSPTPPDTVNTRGNVYRASSAEVLKKRQENRSVKEVSQPVESKNETPKQTSQSPEKQLLEPQYSDMVAAGAGVMLVKKIRENSTVVTTPPIKSPEAKSRKSRSHSFSHSRSHSRRRHSRGHRKAPHKAHAEQKGKPSRSYSSSSRSRSRSCSCSSCSSYSYSHSRSLESDRYRSGGSSSYGSYSYSYSSSEFQQDPKSANLDFKRGMNQAPAKQFFTDVPFRLTQRAYLEPFAENAFIYEWNLKDGYWNKVQTTVVLFPEPFSHGNMRASYYIIDMNRLNCPLVTKRYLKKSVEDCQYFDDVSMHSISGHWARLFNALNPPKKVKFIPAAVLELPERPLILALEPQLDGTFKKYNNNCGYVPRDARWTPQAFSHFTYEASQHELMIVDIQGVDDIYTDPQILSPDGEGYGRGNLGEKGIRRFIESHKCNGVCRYLKLSPLSLSNLSKKPQHSPSTGADSFKAIERERLPPKMYTKEDTNNVQASPVTPKPNGAQTPTQAANFTSPLYNLNTALIPPMVSPGYPAGHDPKFMRHIQRAVTRTQSTYFTHQAGMAPVQGMGSNSNSTSRTASPAMHTLPLAAGIRGSPKLNGSLSPTPPPPSDGSPHGSGGRRYFNAQQQRHSNQHGHSDQSGSPPQPILSSVEGKPSRHMNH